MRHDFSKILTLYYIAINLEISDFEMSDKFLDPSIASHEVLLYYKFFSAVLEKNHKANCTEEIMLSVETTDICLLFWEIFFSGY